ncbi:MAG: hypothetical protein ACI9NQ_001584, partial [Paracoccaceae bacterium]
MSQNIPSSSIPPAREPVPGNSEADKEQYSLDEMMKALREKEREKDEKGEVVTRSDGSVARKVKRRKRRSDQPETPTPEKEQKKLLFKVIAAFSLVLALFLGGLFLLLSHNSKSHRQELEKTASEWTGAEVELNGYKRLPFSATIQSAKFKWPASSYLRELQVSKIDGDVGFTSFLGARTGGLQLGGSTGKLVVGMPTASGEVGQSLEEGEFPFAFDQYYCQALDVTFGESQQVSLKGASASLRYVANGGFQVTLDQGTLMLDGWTPFPISSGLMRFNDGVIDIKSLSLDQPKGENSLMTSNLIISGRIPLTSGEKARLTAVTGHFSLSSLVGEKLSRFFSGAVVASEGEISYTVGEDQIDEIVMGFTADRVKMEGLPFLANLAELFPDRNLEGIEFDRGIKDSAITGTLRIRPEGVAIEKLEMAHKGSIKLQGGIVVFESGKIGGKFDMALNRAFVASQPRFAKSPLLPGTEKTGFINLSIKVGGTLAQPTDTFLSEFGLETGLPGSQNENQDGV